MLLAELAEVLARPSPGKRLALIGRTGQSVLADYLEALEFVVPDDVPRVVPGDPDDDHVIAAAVSADASVIVSGDVDLLALGRHRDIEIVSPAAAIRLLEADAGGEPTPPPPRVTPP